MDVISTHRHEHPNGIPGYLEPEAIAELMAFLVSPGARLDDGATLRMHGGAKVRLTNEVAWGMPSFRPVRSRVTR